MNGALNCRMPQLPRCEFVQSRQRIGIPAHHLRDETLFLSPRWGWPHFRLAPMACAMGCMLTPLRGLKTALCGLRNSACGLEHTGCAVQTFSAHLFVTFVTRSTHRSRNSVDIESRRCYSRQNSTAVECEFSHYDSRPELDSN